MRADIYTGSPANGFTPQPPHHGNKDGSTSHYKREEVQAEVAEQAPLSADRSDRQFASQPASTGALSVSRSEGQEEYKGDVLAPIVGERVANDLPWSYAEMVSARGTAAEDDELPDESSSLDMVRSIVFEPMWC